MQPGAHQNREQVTVPRSAGVQVAPSTYYAAKTRQPCAREQRDATTIPVLVGIWEDN